MDFSSLTRNARICVRAELLAAELRLSLKIRKLALLMLAAALALFAIVLLNIAFYVELETVWGPVWTPLALALFNIVLAAIIAAVAVSSKPGPELELADELRKVSEAALENDLRGGIGVSQLLAGGARDSGALHLLVPVIGMVLGAMKKRRQKQAES